MYTVYVLKFTFLSSISLLPQSDLFHSLGSPCLSPDVLQDADGTSYQIIPVILLI